MYVIYTKTFLTTCSGIKMTENAYEQDKKPMQRSTDTTETLVSLMRGP